MTKRREFFAAYDALLARWPAGWRPVDVASPYGTTRVNVSGPEGAPPLVLFHGFGATSAVWFATVSELSRAWRVHAVDHMGDAGRSVPDGRPIRTADDAMDWIDSLRSGLGLERAALCGHSYGSWLALRYALQAPERTRALAMLDPTQCFAGYRLSYLAHSIPVVARPTAARALAMIRWETGGAPVDPAWLRLAGLAAEVPWSGPVRTRRPARARFERLARLAVPTLVVLAERSQAHDIRRVAAGARQRLPNARVEVLPGASHHSIPAEPAEPAGALSRLLLDFLPVSP